ncbi:MAG TPA: Ppx/GppA family phosphatase [Myxococcaceae bacterium]|nr:Ppx/GppA family phosphatase [Myxococcaceae bacterium]
MPRFATIDIGTNSVLLLVAERDQEGRFSPVLERAALTRLGRGVDGTRRLSEEGITQTLAAVEAFAKEARALDIEGLAVSATSAARDATNGDQFLEEARRIADVEVEIISGDAEARLVWLAVQADFGGSNLCVVDIGGGSTEVIYGTAQGQRTYARSLDVGSVRLTERFLPSDPPSPEGLAHLLRFLGEEFAQLPHPPAGATVVGTAGTVTTLLSIRDGIEPYDASRVHGARLTKADLVALIERLSRMPLEERRQVKGLEPARADVIVAGALILLAALERLGADVCVVGDRGVRWGLLQERFGAGRAS